MAWPPKALRIVPFGVGDPIDDLGDGLARNYLRRYLADLAASTIIEEAYYFDRDYLAEFVAFYSTSSRGYPNVCRRLHFFDGDPALTREDLEAACGGDHDAQQRMTENYLGFAVLRPFDPPRLGRTVLKWYSDTPPAGLGPRVTAPSRAYRIHLAGIRLVVHGLAWQQQDTSVGTCATVALWSMLHSSAFDDHHAIPTTANITQSAHRAGSLGRRIFPSAGLTAQQLCEAVQAQGLSPILLEPDLEAAGRSGFSLDRFASSCAAFIRSGYPVLVAGELWERSGGSPTPTSLGHAICLTGFRDCPPASGASGDVVLADAGIPVVYGHDDNLGPNVKLSLSAVPGSGFAILTPTAPIPRVSPRPVQDPTVAYPSLVPYALLVAVHNDLRTSPDKLHEIGLTLAKTLSLVLARLATSAGAVCSAVSLSTRFIGVREYMRDELPRVLSANNLALSRVRLGLLEQVEPMSLHLGLVRLGLGSQPLLDVLYDTTDSDLSPRAFAHVEFAHGAGQVLAVGAQIQALRIGKFLCGA